MSEPTQISKPTQPVKQVNPTKTKRSREQEPAKSKKIRQEYYYNSTLFWDERAD